MEPQGKTGFGAGGRVGAPDRTWSESIGIGRKAVEAAHLRMVRSNAEVRASTGPVVPLTKFQPRD